MGKNVKRIAFSDEQIFTLIQLYQENECLWNINVSDYKNNIKRKAAVSTIAEKMGLSEDLVKKKISSLRATYLMEKKKIYDSRRTCLGTDDLYSPTVPWFGHMHFLNDVIIARKITSNLDSQAIKNEDETSNIVTHIDTAKSAWSESEIVPIAQEQPPVKKIKNSSADTTNASSDKPIDDVMKPNIFDNFGTLIASQLRSLPMEDALQLQMDVSHLVNSRLLTIYRKRNKINTLSSSSRPSTSSLQSHSEYNYNHTSEYTQNEQHLSQDFNEPEEDHNMCESKEVVQKALHGVFNDC